MATTPPTPPPGITLSIPNSLNLKDLITIVSAAVTLTVAWGVFGTRLTVLEKEVAALRGTDSSVSTQVDRLRKQVRRLEAHQQDDELLLDQVFILLKRPLPKRTTVVPE